MVGVVLNQFGGMIPRRASSLLPEPNGTTVRNANLLSGELRAMRMPYPLFDFNPIAQQILKAYRLPLPDLPGQYETVGFDSLDADLIKGPLINDAFERYYLFGDGYPKYNTLDRIRTGDPWLRLGVYRPSAAPSLAVVGGTGTITVTRAYVYTFVTVYGEEGANSDPVLESGKIDGSWNLSGLQTAANDPFSSERLYTKKRIYRTVAGYEATRYFFVAEIDISDTTYSDTSDDNVVAQNRLLESTTWAQPPDNIEGALVMPNGYIVAWAGRDIFLSEAYRPHAWPVEYAQSTEYAVVGLGVFGQSVVVVTKSQPYVGGGVNPAAFTLQKTNTIEPGLSRYGIVSFPYGVMYPSQNGLVLVGPNGPDIITRQLLTKYEWENYSPSQIIATKYGTQYLAFYTPLDGFILDPAEPMAAFVELSGFMPVDNLQTDPNDGVTFLLSDNVVYEWDSEQQIPATYQFLSKEYDTPRPVNFGAMKIEFGELPDFENVLVAAQMWNTMRMDYPLDTIGGNCLGCAEEIAGLPPGIPQNRQALGGSPLVVLAAAAFGVRTVSIRVWAGSALVFETTVEDDRLLRLPSGFKSDEWFIEVFGQRPIRSIKMAETSKELAKL